MRGDNHNYHKTDYLLFSAYAVFKHHLCDVCNTRHCSCYSGRYSPCLILYLFQIAPRREKTQQYRLRLLIGGYELVLSAFSCFLFEALAYLFVLVKGTEIGVHILIINIFVCAGLLFVLLFNGIIRIFTCSEQLGIVPRISLLLFWWMPVVNLVILRKFLGVSASEYQFTIEKLKRNKDRKCEELCKTRIVPE